jgi:thymidylate synthase
MFTIFEAETGSEAWLKAADALIESKIDIQDSRNGPTKEILHAAFVINDPRQRWVLSRKPGMNPAFAIAEVIWILSGRHDSAFLNYYNPKLPGFQGNGPEYHGAYGYRLRRQFGFDQIERAYQVLKHNPDTRQVVLQIWSATIDLPHDDGSPMERDIPCNLMSILKVRNGRLEWMQIMRSNDLIRGVPHNFVQFTTLQEVMAGWLGIAVGPYHQISDSLHAYTEGLASEIRDREILVEKNTDSLLLAKDEFEYALRTLELAAEKMTDPVIGEDDLYAICDSTDLPIAYKNMLLMCGADAARRRDWYPVASNIASSCTNPVLRQAWARWLARRRSQETPVK